ncbi:ORF6C domain-containing protein [Paenibacillus sp. EKM102P]|uniref:Rha family transcriptional regulator n=1 Tax=unclassified Paenibacillus TaxID=185978 RepID=UPI00142DBFC7|nr:MULTISPECIES: Rha family transcriptional regulator [unclassified Paenibacillus]KAF6618306.1 ORF6C domain-containing protein [Paenibacillus sp. EKM101P]KAF6624652.1 ORF6C domain-containing protein [Paenibacillus sp. EKM102P]KAF6635569.1 ORF6C domain-containing protein [Paenibacillus sp. EKM10P]KAF6648721.1 ORF6C domain-containing protein [Paenibacillus sp. EKM11P]
MTQLVFIENGQTVTDSLTVAEVFKKEHKHVLRDIKSLECSEEFIESNFGLIDYTDSRNRTQQKYIISQDGFSFLAMGYTGKEAARFKEMYITEFNRMKETMSKPPVLDSNAAIAIALRQTADVMDKLPQIESRMDRIENTTTIDYGQQRALKKAGSSRVVGFLGGRKSAAYKHSGIRSSAYSALWNDYQEYFGINSYNNTLKKDCERGLKYVASWTPPNNLMIEIEETNGQKLF